MQQILLLWSILPDPNNSVVDMAWKHYENSVSNKQNVGMRIRSTATIRVECK